MLNVEQLEDRCLPAPIAHVQVDTLFIGDNPNAAQMNALLSFCVTTVMPELLGVYGIGQGSFGTSDSTPYPGPVVYDGASIQSPQIQQIIGQEMSAGRLPHQDGNQFIVVFIAPGIQVVNSSFGPFLAYHWGASIQGQTIPYAVIPYPQPPNPSDTPVERSLEVSVTHELEEGLCNFTSTIPMNGEVGDKYNRQWFYDNGWHIQVAEGPQGQMLALGPINQEPAPPVPPIQSTLAAPDFFALAVEEFWLDTYMLLAHFLPGFNNQLQAARDIMNANPAHGTATGKLWLEMGDQLFYQVATWNV